jgi:hypothetical protein
MPGEGGSPQKSLPQREIIKESRVEEEEEEKGDFIYTVIV